MKNASVYIFNNTEDRRNKEMYKELAELICRINGPINTQNFAEARKADRFYKTYDEAYEGNKTDLPYFETRKGDLFLWVEGKYSMNDVKYLYEAVRTAEEKALVDKVMIGYTYHYESENWFRELDDEIAKKIMGKSTELMRQEKYKKKVSDTEAGKTFYAIMDHKGTVVCWTKKGAEEAAQSREFVNNHIVIYEGTAADPDEFKEKTNTVMEKKITVSGSNEAVVRYEYYDMMFNYFLRLQWEQVELPANFWDWLATDGRTCFEMAKLYMETRMFCYTLKDKKTA